MSTHARRVIFDSSRVHVGKIGDIVFPELTVRYRLSFILVISFYSSTPNSMFTAISLSKSIKRIETKSTELSPSIEGANCSATQHFRKILWNPKVDYRTQKRPPLVPPLSQINPVLTIQCSFSQLNFNIIYTHRHTGLHSRTPSAFLTSVLSEFLLSTIPATHPDYPILLD